MKVHWDGRELDIELAWVGAADAAPLIVFLHEGLGSVSLWRDFPQRLCAAVGAQGLVYSRPGYGRSTPRAPHERWAPDFMHRQAWELLPALLHELGVDARQRTVWLFGHSDGASIALLHAARHGAALAGVVALAPHTLVEDVSVRSIEQARIAYETTDLRSRLARHHLDPDSAFWGWNRIWLDPAFRGWNIGDDVARIPCPVLAIQGEDDEYGTMEQIDGIARRLPGTRLLKLARCGHSPHKDQPEAVTEATAAFMRSTGTRNLIQSQA